MSTLLATIGPAVLPILRLAVAEDFQCLDPLAEAEGGSFAPHLVDQFIHDLSIEELQGPVSTVDDGDLGAEIGEHRGVFDADHASTDHSQRPGQ